MRRIALAALISVLAIPAQGASLTTTFDSHFGQDGNMFDILVGAQDIKITGFDLNLGFGTVDLEWYISKDTHVGSANAASDWTRVDTISGVTTSGRDDPTHWNVSDTTFSAGQSYGFYITTTSTGTMWYTSGTGVGNVVASDTALTIYEGLGVMYAFGSTVAPRIWNGTIYYETLDVTPIPLPAAGWLLLAALGTLGFARYRRNRLPHSQA